MEKQPRDQVSQWISTAIKDYINATIDDPVSPYDAGLLLPADTDPSKVYGLIGLSHTELNQVATTGVFPSTTTIFPNVYDAEHDPFQSAIETANNHASIHFLCHALRLSSNDTYAASLLNDLLDTDNPNPIYAELNREYHLSISEIQHAQQSANDQRGLIVAVAEPDKYGTSFLDIITIAPIS